MSVHNIALLYFLFNKQFIKLPHNYCNRRAAAVSIGTGDFVSALLHRPEELLTYIAFIIKFAVDKPEKFIRVKCPVSH